MCRWIAYSGSPISPENYLYEEQFSLVEQSQHARKSKSIVNGDGFGLGWYGNLKQPGLFRDILPAWNNENLRSLAHQIEARIFMAHVRAATDTAINRDNCHPFAVEDKLFMHNGQIGEYLKVRRQLENLLDDKLFTARLGNTDSELLFLLLIQYEVETDFAAAVEKLISTVQEKLAGLAITDPFRFTAVHSEGTKLKAVRYSSDRFAPTLFYHCTETGCLLVSEPLDDDLSGWQKLQHNQTITIEQSGEIEIRELNSLCSVRSISTPPFGSASD